MTKIIHSMLLVGMITVIGSTTTFITIADAQENRPNIVLILTDDQRWDTLNGMPSLKSGVIDKGINFINGFVVNPLCCPSRASILTGQYAHSTGIYKNTPPNGGFANFRDASTIATWLKATGYRTAYIGKYLNGYNNSGRNYVPRGWDNWVVFSKKSQSAGYYYNYSLNINRKVKSFGSREIDYGTDVIKDEAVSFVRNTTQQPFFMVFAPYAPHSPAISAPRHEKISLNLPPNQLPSYNEADVSDKPAWVKKLPLLSSKDQADIESLRLKQYKTLLAVDEAIAEILTALENTGRLNNTMIVFTSDNGLHRGEHRIKGGKSTPYEESIRVPFVIRYDPLISSPRDESRFALNVDLAPTFAELAGVSSPGAEGMSLVPLLSDPENAAWRQDFLIEYAGELGVPPYCAVRNDSFIYIRYAPRKEKIEELYNLTQDSYELDNLILRMETQPILSNMRNRLKTLCSPVPPGYGALTNTLSAELADHPDSPEPY